MRKTVQLIIPDPCSENWGEMSPNGQGRFCGKCEKTVVDFTGMSPMSILNLLNNSSDEVCGRIRPSQMTIVPPIPATFYQPEFSLRAVVLGLALTTFCALNASAQQEPIQGGISVEQAERQIKFSANDSLEYTVVSKDEAGKIIANAIVRVNYTDGSFQTFPSDENGTCRFRTAKRISGVIASFGSDLRSDYSPAAVFDGLGHTTLVLRDFDPPVMGKVAPPRKIEK